MSKKISTLTSGSLVKVNENGVAKKHIFLGYNHYGKGEVTLLRKDASGYQAHSAGSSSYNVYNGCSLDTFCNEQHIQCLDPVIRACLVDVPIPTIRGHVQGAYDSTVETLMRKCFALSNAEVGFSGADGSKFPYFAADANRIAYMDGTAVAVYWWLRSPDSGNSNYAYSVNSNGTQYHYDACRARYCARPALALSSEILVSDSANSDGCYTIEDAVIAGEQYQKVNGVWRRMC